MISSPLPFIRYTPGVWGRSASFCSSRGVTVQPVLNSRSTARGRSAIIARVIAGWTRRLAVVAVLGGAASCGPAGELRYQVVFPSEAAAVQSDEIEVAAFDGTAPSVCLDLVERARTRQALPTALA